MVYITGDTHAVFTRFGTKVFPEQKEMARDDFVIICGFKMDYTENYHDDRQISIFDDEQ